MSRPDFELMTRGQLLQWFKTFCNSKGWDGNRVESYRTTKMKKEQLMLLCESLWTNSDNPAVVDIDDSPQPNVQRLDQYFAEKKIMERFKTAVLVGMYDRDVALECVLDYARVAGYADIDAAATALWNHVIEQDS